MWRIRADEYKDWMTRFQNWTSSDILKRQRYQARCRDSFLGLPNSNRTSKDEGGTCNTKEWASPRTLAQVMAAGHHLFAVTGEEASVGPTPTAALWQHNSWLGWESRAGAGVTSRSRWRGARVPKTSVFARFTQNHWTRLRFSRFVSGFSKPVRFFPASKHIAGLRV